MRKFFRPILLKTKKFFVKGLVKFGRMPIKRPKTYRDKHSRKARRIAFKNSRSVLAKSGINYGHYIKYKKLIKWARIIQLQRLRFIGKKWNLRKRKNLRHAMRARLRRARKAFVLKLRTKFIAKARREGKYIKHRNTSAATKLFRRKIRRQIKAGPIVRKEELGSWKLTDAKRNYLYRHYLSVIRHLRKMRGKKRLSVLKWKRHHRRNPAYMVLPRASKNRSFKYSDYPLVFASNRMNTKFLYDTLPYIFRHYDRTLPTENFFCIKHMRHSKNNIFNLELGDPLIPYSGKSAWSVFNHDQRGALRDQVSALHKTMVHPDFRLRLDLGIQRVMKVQKKDEQEALRERFKDSSFKPQKILIENSDGTFRLGGTAKYASLVGNVGQTNKLENYARRLERLKIMGDNRLGKMWSQEKILEIADKPGVSKRRFYRHLLFNRQYPIFQEKVIDDEFLNAITSPHLDLFGVKPANRKQIRLDKNQKKQQSNAQSLKASPVLQQQQQAQPWYRRFFNWLVAPNVPRPKVNTHVSQARQLLLRKQVNKNSLPSLSVLNRRFRRNVDWKVIHRQGGDEEDLFNLARTIDLTEGHKSPYRQDLDKFLDGVKLDRSFEDQHDELLKSALEKQNIYSITTGHGDIRDYYYRYLSTPGWEQKMKRFIGPNRIILATYPSRWQEAKLFDAQVGGGYRSHIPYHYATLGLKNRTSKKKNHHHFQGRNYKYFGYPIKSRGGLLTANIPKLNTPIKAYYFPSMPYFSGLISAPGSSDSFYSNYPKEPLFDIIKLYFAKNFDNYHKPVWDRIHDGYYFRHLDSTPARRNAERLDADLLVNGSYIYKFKNAGFYLKWPTFSVFKDQFSTNRKRARKVKLYYHPKYRPLFPFARIMRVRRPGGATDRLLSRDPILGSDRIIMFTRGGYGAFNYLKRKKGRKFYLKFQPNFFFRKALFSKPKLLTVEDMSNDIVHWFVLHGVRRRASYLELLKIRLHYLKNYFLKHDIYRTDLEKIQYDSLFLNYSKKNFSLFQRFKFRFLNKYEVLQSKPRLSLFDRLKLFLTGKVLKSLNTKKDYLIFDNLKHSGDSVFKTRPQEVCKKKIFYSGVGLKNKNKLIASDHKISSAFFNFFKMVFTGFHFIFYNVAKFIVNVPSTVTNLPALFFATKDLFYSIFKFTFMNFLPTLFSSTAIFFANIGKCCGIIISALFEMALLILRVTVSFIFSSIISGVKLFFVFVASVFKFAFTCLINIFIIQQEFLQQIPFFFKHEILSFKFHFYQLRNFLLGPILRFLGYGDFPKQRKLKGFSFKFSVVFPKFKKLEFLKNPTDYPNLLLNANHKKPAEHRSFIFSLGSAVKSIIIKIWNRLEFIFHPDQGDIKAFANSRDMDLHNVLDLCKVILKMAEKEIIDAIKADLDFSAFYEFVDEDLRFIQFNEMTNQWASHLTHKIGKPHSAFFDSYYGTFSLMDKFIIMLIKFSVWFWSNWFIFFDFLYRYTRFFVFKYVSVFGLISYRDFTPVDWFTKVYNIGDLRDDIMEDFSTSYAFSLYGFVNEKIKWYFDEKEEELWERLGNIHHWQRILYDESDPKIELDENMYGETHLNRHMMTYFDEWQREWTFKGWLDDIKLNFYYTDIPWGFYHDLSHDVFVHISEGLGLLQELILSFQIIPVILAYFLFWYGLFICYKIYFIFYCINEEFILPKFGRFMRNHYTYRLFLILRGIFIVFRGLCIFACLVLYLIASLWSCLFTSTVVLWWELFCTILVFYFADSYYYRDFTYSQAILESRLSEEDDDYEDFHTMRADHCEAQMELLEAQNEDTLERMNNFGEEYRHNISLYIDHARRAYARLRWVILIAVFREDDQFGKVDFGVAGPTIARSAEEFTSHFLQTNFMQPVNTFASFLEVELFHHHFSRFESSVLFNTPNLLDINYFFIPVARLHNFYPVLGAYTLFNTISGHYYLSNEMGDYYLRYLKIVMRDEVK
jgi:hypothetical protein